MWYRLDVHQWMKAVRWLPAVCGLMLMDEIKARNEWFTDVNDASSREGDRSAELAIFCCKNHDIFSEFGIFCGLAQRYQIRYQIPCTEFLFIMAAGIPPAILFYRCRLDLSFFSSPNLPRSLVSSVAVHTKLIDYATRVLSDVGNWI